MRKGLFLLFVLVVALVASLGSAEDWQEETRVDFYHIAGCAHCAEQDVWNRKLEQAAPVMFVYRDVSSPEDALALEGLLKSRNLSLGLPVTVIGEDVFVGFDAGIAVQIRERLGIEDSGGAHERKLPLWLLAVSLGFLDGVNPCAMWVLLFLMGLLIGVRNRARLWLFGGTFLLASGVLYFLFMTAWLNLFFVIGYLRMVQVGVGVGAFIFGVYQLREFVKANGALVCNVKTGKEGVMRRIERLVRAPMTWGVMVGVAALAFSVNLIEFLCSSALPVVFTQALALQALPAWQYYAYVVLYDVFFMLDDVVVFLFAAWAIPHIGERYAGWCRLISAIVLIILAFFLMFWPQALI